MSYEGYSFCRHCGKRIIPDALWARWVHVQGGSIYCGQSATVKASPR